MNDFTENTGVSVAPSSEESEEDVDVDLSFPVSLFGAVGAGGIGGKAAAVGDTSPGHLKAPKLVFLRAEPESGDGGEAEVAMAFLGASGAVLVRMPRGRETGVVLGGGWVVVRTRVGTRGTGRAGRNGSEESGEYIGFAGLLLRTPSSIVPRRYELVSSVPRIGAEPFGRCGNVSEPKCVSVVELDWVSVESSALKESNADRRLSLGLAEVAPLKGSPRESPDVVDTNSSFPRSFSLSSCSGCCW